MENTKKREVNVLAMNGGNDKTSEDELRQRIFQLERQLSATTKQAKDQELVAKDRRTLEAIYRVGCEFAREREFSNPLPNPIAVTGPAGQQFLAALMKIGYESITDLLDRPAHYIVGFHGTHSADAICGIFEENFDPKRRSGQVHGPGEYFDIDRGQVAKKYSKTTNCPIVTLIAIKDSKGLPLPEIKQCLMGQCRIAVVNNPLHGSYAFNLPCAVASTEELREEVTRRVAEKFREQFLEMDLAIPVLQAPTVPPTPMAEKKMQGSASSPLSMKGVVNGAAEWLSRLSGGGVGGKLSSAATSKKFSSTTTTTTTAGGDAGKVAQSRLTPSSSPPPASGSSLNISTDVLVWNKSELESGKNVRLNFTLSNMSSPATQGHTKLDYKIKVTVKSPAFSVKPRQGTLAAGSSVVIAIIRGSVQAGFPIPTAKDKQELVAIQAKSTKESKYTTVKCIRSEFVVLDAKPSVSTDRGNWNRGTLPPPAAAAAPAPLAVQSSSDLGSDSSSSGIIPIHLRGPYPVGNLCILSSKYVAFPKPPSFSSSSRGVVQIAAEDKLTIRSTYKDFYYRVRWCGVDLLYSIVSSSPHEGGVSGVVRSGHSVTLSVLRDESRNTKRVVWVRETIAQTRGEAELFRIEFSDIPAGLTAANSLKEIDAAITRNQEKSSTNNDDDGVPNGVIAQAWIFGFLDGRGYRPSSSNPIITTNHQTGVAAGSSTLLDYSPETPLPKIPISVSWQDDVNTPTDGPCRSKTSQTHRGINVVKGRLTWCAGAARLFLGPVFLYTFGRAYYLLMEELEMSDGPIYIQIVNCCLFFLLVRFVLSE